MKPQTKRAVLLGALCILLTVLSAGYTAVFNESRFLVPMELSTYEFRVRDLPMLLSGVLLTAYLVYLAVLLFRAAQVRQRREAAAQITRTLSPKLGFLGLFGFAGFLGFWTYSVDQTIFPFWFFVFFGFFGFFYEGRMSGTLMDERYLENKLRAQTTADRTAFALLFVAATILVQGRLLGSLDYTLIALVITVALSFALNLFLREYLFYRYDHDDVAESEE